MSRFLSAVRLPATFPALVVAVLLAVDPLAAQDARKQLKAKDPTVRLLAIDKLAREGDEKTDKLLVSALKDRDWEVKERAAEALGRRRFEKALKPLVDLAVKGEVRRMRRAAARAAAAIDADAALAALLKKVTGKTVANACAAVVDVCEAARISGSAAKLQKLLKSKDAIAREAGARAWLAASSDRGGALGTLLGKNDLVLVTAALDQVVASPRSADVDALAVAFGSERVTKDVVERRYVRAAKAVLASAATDANAAWGKIAAAAAASDAGRVRLARLVESLARSKVEVLSPAAATEVLEPFLSATAAPARSAAAKALRAVGGEAATAAALARFGNEPEARVRYQLLDTVVVTRGLAEPAHVSWVADVLAKDADARVRERACVLLGEPELKGNLSALQGAIADRDWTVAVCAAVSLGKSGHADAVPTLLELAKHEDWKRRGAAVVGMMWANRKEVVPALIDALSDTVPSVSGSALAALHKISARTDLGTDPTPWRAWWQDKGATYVFQDWRKLEERRKKYGYEVPDREIYRGLDIVVLVSRGDHIEELLDELEIESRKTQASKVARVGLTPESVFVVNCTGEIEDNDVEPIRWFVVTGGYLFGSCWALNKTIERVYPGIVRKLETPLGEVLDDVRAWPCAESTYLTGVFPDTVIPIYHLEGAHLIEVLDQERGEVLIDSPDAAQRHGGGNLAAWFRAGHGTILDSANHFDLQGLEVAQGLKTPQQRQAYAIDHMGLSYTEWRESKREKYWSTSPKAARHVFDLSAFRFITNFVRSKRIGGDDGR